MRKLLVTGGAGFIGSHFIRHVLCSAENTMIYNMDKLSYAGDLERLADIRSDERYRFVRCDICDEAAVNDVFSEGLDAVVHFAAESHVDRSIQNAKPFQETNVLGTLTLLDAATKHGVGRFIHISTDEVYGELGEDGQFNENSPLRPNSPYSASKAAADHFVLAYHHTYGIPAIIVRPSNNYGPFQYPEKLIPVVISRALDDRPVPVYAKGENVREWLYVEDCVKGIFTILERGRVGEVYNLGSGQERRNIDVVKGILHLLGKPEALIEYIKDRPGHDFRYSLNVDKIMDELGFACEKSFDKGLENTVSWYHNNEGWWRTLNHTFRKYE